MKISTTVFLALILSGLGVYYFSTERFPSPVTGELSPVEIMMLAEDDAISWLQIQNLTSKETMTLVKENSEWKLEFPVSYPAEPLLVRGMAASLTRVQRLRRLPVKGELPKELGLGSPKIRIGVETENQARRRHLLLGENTALANGVYARWEDEDEYFIAPSQFKAAFERSVYSLRQKKLFRINWDQIEWMEARVKRRTYRLERQDQKWRGQLLDRKYEIPLEKVEDLVYAFQSLYVKEFLDGRNPLKVEFGIGSGEISLAVGDKQGGVEKVLVGAPPPAGAEGEALYAAREKENLLLLVSEPGLNAVLDKVKLIFTESPYGDSRSAPWDSGKDSEVVSKSGEKPV